MPVGMCRLCGEPRELKNSRFIPAAFCKSARDSDPNHDHPVVVTKNTVVQTSKQATAPVLCGECEDRFNKSGEKWTLGNAWRADGTFPLRSALQVSTPSYSTPGFAIYGTAGLAGVDQQRLVYFGTSIFWRASIKDWQFVENTKALELGPYEEEFRLFLLEKSDFPADAALMLSVSVEQDARASATDHRRHRETGW